MAQRQELEYIQFDPQNQEEEEDTEYIEIPRGAQYVFDPDAPETEEYEDDEIFAPRRRKKAKKRKPKTRTRWRTRVKTRWRKAKKRIRRRLSPLSKVTKIINQIVPVGGFVLGLMSDPMADGRGIGGAFGFIQDRITKWRLPSFDAIKWWLFDPYAPPIYKAPIWGGLVLGIGFQILSKFKINPILNRISKPLSKLGWGLLAGGIVGMILFLGGSEGTKFTKTPPEAYNNTPNRNYGGSGSNISEQQAYAHILQQDAFRRR